MVEAAGKLFITRDQGSTLATVDLTTKTVSQRSLGNFAYGGVISDGARVWTLAEGGSSGNVVLSEISTSDSSVLGSAVVCPGLSTG